MINYYCGQIIEKGQRKKGLYLAIFFNFLTLGFFKYFNFSFDNLQSFINLFGVNTNFAEALPIIALPIGISFFTFQGMSYVIDVYRNDVKASKNFTNFLAYITMFPQLVAGPIVRYIDIEKQLNKREVTVENFALGLERFIVGLAKKMLVANTFGLVADMIFKNQVSDLSTLMVWTGIIAYSFQIYFDFSGYSCMAIGLGRMFGFTFLENFNYPYISKSIKEFWRRWHISLSTWFRDYVYIPLGGSKVSNIKIYRNLLIVFFVTGLWHGASWNFIVWGMYHGLFILIERLGFDKILEKLWQPIQHVYTLLIVIIGWVFFRSEDLTYAMQYIERMFCYHPGNMIVNDKLNYFYITSEFYITLILGIALSTPIYIYFYNHIISKLQVLKPIVYLILFLLTLVYVSASSYNPFIYFKF
jgi:alginate O-acetyltransferase complex protein AlgI